MLAIALVGVLGACVNNTKSKPLEITVWTYYNGDQLEAFNDLIDEYNATRGKECNVVVVGHNLGSVDDLKDSILDSANGKVGAQDLPNMFAGYADTAYAVDQMGLVADLSPYFTDKERAAHIDEYLEEGSLGEEGSQAIKIFPVAKSVELVLLNTTDFEPFAQAESITYDDLATYEGMAATAKKYYEWTDAQTDEPYDGKAFFGLDSLANYFYIGAQQQGVSLVTVEDGKAKLNFNKAVVRKLWDNYYVPMVMGYYDASSRYRSDDIKTGNIICLQGSSSGATYFPQQIVDAQGESHEIDMEVLPCLQFENGDNIAVQQGAGMVVINSSDEEVKASVDFLKWVTQPEQNLAFSMESGYLPVLKEANDIEVMRRANPDLDTRMEKILTCAIETTSENTLYTPPPFKRGSDVRAILEQSLFDQAKRDAQSVSAAVKDGKSLENAAAPYLTDATFEQWYRDVKAQLEALV